MHADIIFVFPYMLRGTAIITYDEFLTLVVLFEVGTFCILSWATSWRHGSWLTGMASTDGTWRYYSNYLGCTCLSTASCFGANFMQSFGEVILVWLGPIFTLLTSV